LGSYDEFDGTSKFYLIPGRAFWVLSKNQIDISFSVSSVDLDQDNIYSINLHANWNLISNPFLKSISWEAIKSVNSPNLETIHYFDSDYLDPPPR